MSGDSDPLPEQLGKAANVLLRAPQRTGAEDRSCIDLLTIRADEPVVSVSLTQSPADRLAVWNRYAEGYPPRAVFVAVESDGDHLAHQLETACPGRSDSTAVAIDRIDHPGDLMRLGVRISERLDELAGAGQRPVMCFHSLTTLLQYVDVERLFRFLHILTSRVRQADGLAHYHLDRASLESETLGTLSRLFDATVDVVESGERLVRT